MVKKPKKEKKVAYIAHPISGDVDGNIERVKEICRKIHMESINIVPMATYIVPLLYLDDNKPKERRLGIESNKMLFKRGGFDELWLCGDRISAGMKEEVELCIEFGIPVICYSSNLTDEFIKFRTTGKWSEED